MAENSSTSQSNYTTLFITEMTIPPLKFFMNNFKAMATTPLTSENYHLWSSQILKLFKAVNLDGFLHGTTPCPPQTLFDPAGSPSPNPHYQQWYLIDQHLSAALSSTISPAILPYILQLDNTAAIWLTLRTRLQATNRSRVLQLKNKLQHLSLKSNTVTQYLSQIKTLVDQIVAAGSHVDNEDVILYILNGLPSPYQPSKATIRTRPGSLTLDELYAMLITEEITLTEETSQDNQLSQIALYSNSAAPPSRGHSSWNHRGRSRNNPSTNRRSDTPTSAPVQCQICSKFGHKASDCWYRYSSSNKASARQALVAGNTTSPAEWILDTGATSHLTLNYNQLCQTEPYQGSSSVIVGDGSALPITNTGDGILPIPNGNLHL